MPLNDFSIGRDIVLRVVTDTGILVLDRLTEFESKPELTELTSAGISGFFETMFQPKRWTGSFMLDRRNSGVDVFFAQIESDFFNNVQRRTATITQSIVERSGAISQFKYLKVALKYADAGSWAGEKLVKQKIEFAAVRRVQGG